MNKLLTILLALAAFCGAQVMAETEKPEREGKGKPKCEEVRDAKKENMAATRTHHKKQMQENKTFREGLADLDPETRIDKIIEHRLAQHRENVKFHNQRYRSMVDAINSCDDLPADRKAELLDKLKTHHEEAINFHNGIHREVMNFLKELKSSDQSPEEKKQAWMTFRNEIEEKVQAWRKEHRPEGRPRGDKKDRQGRKDKGPRTNK